MRFTNLFNPLSFALTTALLAACPPVEKGDTDSDGSSATSDEPGTGTTGEAPTTGGVESTSTSAGESTAGGDAVGCAAQCAKESECYQTPVDDCLAACERTGDGFGYSGPECRALFDEMTTCKGAASCQELDSGACDPEFEPLVSACTSELCRDKCAKQLECGLIGADEQTFCGFKCTQTIAYATIDIGPECGASYEKVYECVVTLTCEQIEQGLEPCDAELAANEQACGQGE